MLLAGLLLVGALSSVQAPRDEESFNWAIRQREAAVVTLLPLAAAEVPAQHEWVVSVRIRPPFRGEGSIEISKMWDGAIVATVRAVRGPPVAEQLARLHRKKRTAPLAQLLADIQVRSDLYRVDECRALQLLVEALGRLSLTAILSSDLAMDATQYDVTSRTRTNSLELLIGGSPPPPLDAWLRQAERLIDGGCAVEQAAPQ